MSQDHRHLTIEELSALLDQQLSEQEQATCQAHLNNCELCPQQLAELQQTILLLHALPQAPLPRSFVLPVEIPIASMIQSKAIAGEDDHTSKTAIHAYNHISVWPGYVRTTMRIASTLVAALGLFFILSGLLTTVLPMHNSAPQSRPAQITEKTGDLASDPSSNTSQQQQPEGSSASDTLPGSAQKESSAGEAETRTSAPPPAISQQQPPAGEARTQTSAPPPAPSQQQQPKSPTIPFFDLDTPEGRLGIGLLLLITGMLSATLSTRLGTPIRKKQSQQ